MLQRSLAPLTCQSYWLRHRPGLNPTPPVPPVPKPSPPTKPLPAPSSLPAKQTRKAKRRCKVKLLRGVGVEDDFYVPPSSSYASSSPIGTTAEPDADSFTDFRAVALFRQSPPTAGNTASWISGFRPSSGSEYHFLAADSPWTALFGRHRRP